ncbi:unnamed protein product [Rotaria magnacalcarata]|uniref:Poly [ADP-ribose] polymerase n=1 Tax=Rotaria magnacalcarata TaxID=392030 RepID=A0A816FN91_9BILA|nr:unnamed protein product [Rotaria magnacalcarata]CAF1663687.1 unnamed protein product [Rotaria magnacalcarata]
MTIEENIARITDSTLTPTDLWPRVCGSTASRESRMEVVAWVAVCKFNCNLEGGFVRDWIVANERVRPPLTIQPSEWVQFDAITGIPSLLKALVPSDIDCKMPLDRYFDVEKFCDEITKFDMKPQIYRSRRSYRLLFDQYQPTGPFTLELIEPHSSVGFRIPDFDVNNLCVKRDQCCQLSQRFDLAEPPYLIGVKQIIANIKCKTFHVLPSLNELITKRINKMMARGWVQNGVPLINRPQQVRPTFVISPLLTSSDLYKNVELAMQKIIGSTIISVQQIYNLELENIWKSMKVLIANECSDSSPNEQFLFHGTHTNKWKRIMEEGFDYGFFKTLGVFGNGAYFADNAQKSHEYTLPMPSDPTMTRIILFSKVALGQEMIMKHMNSALYAAPRDHHSVHGIASDSSEYVIYRLTQALPFLIITYQVHSS